METPEYARGPEVERPKYALEVEHKRSGLQYVIERTGVSGTTRIVARFNSTGAHFAREAVEALNRAAVFEVEVKL